MSAFPARLKRAFPGHAVRTVTEVGWKSAKDVPLLELAGKSYDVFVTVDRRFARQADISRYQIGVLIVRVPNNRFESFFPFFPELVSAAERVKSGQVIQLGGVGR